MKKLILILNLFAINLYFVSINGTFNLENKSGNILKIVAAIHPWKILNINRMQDIEMGYQIRKTYYNSFAYNRRPELLNIIKQAYDNMTKSPNKFDEYLVIRKIDAYLKNMKNNGGKGNNLDQEIFFKINGLSKKLEEIQPIRDLSSNNYYELLDKFLKENLNEIKESADFLKLIKCDSKVIFSNLPINFLKSDILSSISELYKISALGSKDKSKVYRAGVFYGLCHFLSLLDTKDIFYKELYRNIFLCFDKKSLSAFEKSVISSRFINVVTNIYNLKFLMKEYHNLKKANKIAKYNKETNRDLSSTRLKQYLWYAGNKLVPYMVFIGSRILYDQDSLLNTFNLQRIVRTKDNNSVYLLELLRAIANVSEIMRKNDLYKSEEGDFLKYFKDLKSFDQKTK
ncbi:hypothetical protein [Candidatus Babela massiliensis]|uniref:Uncharacterized protein n=1 Tax=Candidatus Babela massiliensis TaxID=673862 RepID=V6DGS0_9BACT|nr:hypothetical protein [Candidatus Babela massiliensis]CDK30797.1 hypothetical protein BABL1_gene_218 [Candidatus Babela massiliensis]